MTIRWPSRMAAFLLWALAALSASFWLLKVIGVSEAPVVAGAISVETPAIDVRDLARALGPDTPSGATTTVAGMPPVQAQDASARMRLLGVVAGRRSGGVALISVDGQLPRPYRVGTQVDASHRLTQVATRSATLSPMQTDGQAFTLELPDAAAEVPPRPTAFGGPAAGRLPGLAQGRPVTPPIPSVAVPAANSATGTTGTTAPGTEEQPKD